MNTLRMKSPKVGDLITRTESGEPVVFRIIEVDQEARSIKVEVVSVAGYMAIGAPMSWTQAKALTENEK